MGRFDHLATQPARGPADLIKWKLASARLPPFEPPRAPFREYDRSAVASGKPTLTWIGHASFLLVLGGLRILIDPLLAPSLGVAGFGPTKRLVDPGVPLADLVDIDVVLLTHNHRDHMDEWTLSRILAAHAIDPAKRGKKTAPLRPRFVVPLGNGKLLSAMGAGAIDELDWWQCLTIGQVEISLVPSRHWSMRLPWDRNDALWGGFVVRGPEGSAYHSGDTGFFDGFAEIGERLGPLDWAMLPTGAYAPRWFMEPQHMDPAASVEAAQALRARAFVAMHWGTYRLTDEPEGDPQASAREAFQRHGLDERNLWFMDVGETRRL